MATSGPAVLALLALALLCRPCLAAADADCKAEEQEESGLLQAESAMLAHRSARAGDRHVQTANSTDGEVSSKTSQTCGAIFIAASWTCCLDSVGNGIGAAPGSICCPSPITTGVLACGAGSVCNPNNGLCFAPGSKVCGLNACAAGSKCWEPTQTCYVPIPDTVLCGQTTMIQCAAGGVCCGNGTVPLCGGAGSTCCYNDKKIANLCAPGDQCTSAGICLAR